MFTIRRFSSSWSSMTTVWNRLRGAVKSSPPSSEAAHHSLESTGGSVASKESAPLTPWTISRAPIEPLRQFWIRTSLFRVSSQKLNLLGRQITRLTLPSALLQMRFSSKRAARKVYSLLLQAQNRISLAPERPDPAKFIVQQAVVGKGPYLKRIDIKGRGRHGIIWRPHSFLRMQLAMPHEDVLLRKQFKLKFKRENRPVMPRMEY